MKSLGRSGNHLLAFSGKEKGKNLRWTYSWDMLLQKREHWCQQCSEYGYGDPHETSLHLQELKHKLVTWNTTFPSTQGNQIALTQPKCISFTSTSFTSFILSMPLFWPSFLGFLPLTRIRSPAQRIKAKH